MATLAWQEANRERRRAYFREWRAANLEHCREKSRQWRRDNAERAAANDRAWLDRNPNYYADNREKYLARSKKWRADNPERVAEYQAKRRALKRAAPRVEKIDRAYVYDRDGGKCHLCGKKAPRRGFHLDHLIPLSRGGSHTHDNLAVSHPYCNDSRGPGRLPAQLRLIG